jgi:hypothetical protein
MTGAELGKDTQMTYRDTPMQHASARPARAPGSMR